MTTKTVDIEEAQKNLPELLSLVKAGTEIILTEGSTLVARLVPAETSPAAELPQPHSSGAENEKIETHPKQRIPGLHAGAIWMSEDFD